MNDRMHFQLNPSTIRSLNNSIFERQTLRRPPEVEIHFNKFGWALYAGSGGGGGEGLIVCIVFVCVWFTDRWAYQWGVGGAYKKQLKEQYPVTLLRMYQPLIF